MFNSSEYLPIEFMSYLHASTTNVKKIGWKLTWKCKSLVLLRKEQSLLGLEFIEYFSVPFFFVFPNVYHQFNSQRIKLRPEYDNLMPAVLGDEEFV